MRLPGWKALQAEGTAGALREEQAWPSASEKVKVESELDRRGKMISETKQETEVMKSHQGQWRALRGGLMQRGSHCELWRPGTAWWFGQGCNVSWLSLYQGHIAPGRESGGARVEAGGFQKGLAQRIWWWLQPHGISKRVRVDVLCAHFEDGINRGKTRYFLGVTDSEEGHQWVLKSTV